MHALTARAARDTLTPDQVATWAACAATALLDLWPEHDYTDAELEDTLRANARRLHGNLGDRLYDAPDGPRLLTRYARSATAAGLLRDAVGIWTAHAATAESYSARTRRRRSRPCSAGPTSWSPPATTPRADPRSGRRRPGTAHDGRGFESHLSARLVTAQAHAAAAVTTPPPRWPATWSTTRCPGSARTTRWRWRPGWPRRTPNGSAAAWSGQRSTSRRS
ncbi:hypothetical protein ACFQ0T_02000 [Kitasatospora gansuensis]